MKTFLKMGLVLGLVAGSAQAEDDILNLFDTPTTTSTSTTTTTSAADTTVSNSPSNYVSATSTLGTVTAADLSAYVTSSAGSQYASPNYYVGVPSGQPAITSYGPDPSFYANDAAAAAAYAAQSQQEQAAQYSACIAQYCTDGSSQCLAMCSRGGRHGRPGRRGRMAEWVGGKWMGQSPGQGHGNMGMGMGMGYKSYNYSWSGAPNYSLGYGGGGSSYGGSYPKSYPSPSPYPGYPSGYAAGSYPSNYPSASVPSVPYYTNMPVLNGSPGMGSNWYYPASAASGSGQLGLNGYSSGLGSNNTVGSQILNPYTFTTIDTAPPAF